MTRDTHAARRPSESAIGHIRSRSSARRPSRRLAAVAATAIPTAITRPITAAGEPLRPGGLRRPATPGIESIGDDAQTSKPQTCSAQSDRPPRRSLPPGERAAAEDNSQTSSTATPTPASHSKTSPQSTPATPCSATPPTIYGPSPAQRSPGSASTSPTSPARQTTRTSRSPKSWSGLNPSTSPSTTSQTYGAARSPTNTSNSTTPTAALTLRRSSPGSGDPTQPRRRSSTKTTSRRSTPGRRGSSGSGRHARSTSMSPER